MKSLKNHPSGLTDKLGNSPLKKIRNFLKLNGPVTIQADLFTSSTEFIQTREIEANQVEMELRKSQGRTYASVASLR